MLSSYKDKQGLAYSILSNEIKNNKISHAYLFDTNGYCDAYNMILSFVKEIFCINEELSVDDKENICKRIDDGNYSELKIIKPDGMYIKKQQILDLQQDFSRTSVEGVKRIYVIVDADKMKNETTNSMLKFLEEPDNNIVAILMTNNYNNMLPTIISRCQVIKFNSDLVCIKNGFEEEIALNLIYEIEMCGISTVLKIKELWGNLVDNKDRDLVIRIFDVMINIYYDVIKINSGITDIDYDRYYDKLVYISNKNDRGKLLSKLNYLLEVKDVIKFNVNINLLIDSVIINLGG
ncbi:MAG: hypothetical protein IJZ79_06220 [Bacilli bacterium]|nr:hypothetical protein [Bacilli bacterium]